MKSYRSCRGVGHTEFRSDADGSSYSVENAERGAREPDFIGARQILERLWVTHGELQLLA